MKSLAIFLGFFCIFLFTTTTVSAYDDYYAWFCFEKPNQKIDQFQIRIATSREEIEKGAEGNLYHAEIFAEDDFVANDQYYCCAVLVAPELWGGFYLAMSTISDNIESEPEITPHKPGNVMGTPDDEIPPLFFQLAVDGDDVNFIRNSKYTSVPFPEDGSASDLERADYDNDDEITSRDYSFVRYQSRYFPIMDN